MGLIQSAVGSLGKMLLRASGTLRDPALISLLGGTPNESGVSVTEENASGFSPVSAAVQQIAGGIAKLPLKVYRKQGDDHSAPATGHPLYRLLHDRPNILQSSIVWRMNYIRAALLWGNGCAEIERDPNTGRPVALHFLRPDWCKPWLAEDGLFWVIYEDPKNGTAKIPYCDLLHLRGFGGELWGNSPIRQHKISLGMGMAAERFGARFFGRGAHPTGVITHPNHLSPEAAKRLQADFERLHSGLGNSHRVAIMEEGSDFKPFSHAPEEAQYIESRKFSIEEVSRIFNIPPHKLRDLTNANNSTLERENTNFLVETLMPWMVQFEQECNHKLLMPHERDFYYVEHVFQGLLRPEMTVRYAAYALGRNWGFLSVNEIRSWERLAPIANGDTYLQPLNMSPIGMQPGAQAPSGAPSSGLADTNSLPDPDSNEAIFAHLRGMLARSPENREMLADLETLLTKPKPLALPEPSGD